MSVGPGRIERRVLKILEWERKNNGGALHRLLDYRDGSHREAYQYQECDTTVGGLVDSILYGCNNDDHPYTDDRQGKAYRSLYQSVCRAVRSLERKGLVKTVEGNTKNRPICYVENEGDYIRVRLNGDLKEQLGLKEKEGIYSIIMQMIEEDMEKIKENVIKQLIEGMEESRKEVLKDFKLGELKGENKNAE